MTVLSWMTTKRKGPSLEKKMVMMFSLAAGKSAHRSTTRARKMRTMMTKKRRERLVMQRTELSHSIEPQADGSIPDTGRFHH